jgi:hypothetical protein
MRSGVLSHTQSPHSLHTAASKITTSPRCSACQFGKQTRCPSPGKVSSVVKDPEGALKKDNLFAVQHVSLDHFVCGTKGCLFTSMGKMSDSEMFDGGCVIINSATGFIHLVLISQS